MSSPVQKRKRLVQMSSHSSASESSPSESESTSSSSSEEEEEEEEEEQDDVKQVVFVESEEEEEDSEDERQRKKKAKDKKKMNKKKARLVISSTKPKSTKNMKQSSLDDYSSNKKESVKWTMVEEDCFLFTQAALGGSTSKGLPPFGKYYITYRTEFEFPMTSMGETQMIDRDAIQPKHYSTCLFLNPQRQQQLEAFYNAQTNTYNAHEVVHSLISACELFLIPPTLISSHPIPVDLDYAMKIQKRKPTAPTWKSIKEHKNFHPDMEKNHRLLRLALPRCLYESFLQDERPQVGLKRKNDQLIEKLVDSDMKSLLSFDTRIKPLIHKGLQHQLAQMVSMDQLRAYIALVPREVLTCYAAVAGPSQEDIRLMVWQYLAEGCAPEDQRAWDILLRVLIYFDPQCMDLVLKRTTELTKQEQLVMTPGPGSGKRHTPDSPSKSDRNGVVVMNGTTQPKALTFP